ncbi:hypothetical protein [Sinomicrobium pectinilyticum]|uniref:hypothetical protein n=1 Tax=Sinomicrobium pectinilyticum TaxID=1084421 RepID=UPI001F0C0F25|nr:hypothetical protein [Sinomicrobium pectinilyticum]
MQDIRLQLKRLGKKKVKTVVFPVEKYPETLSGLIEQCVISEVKRYNNERTEILLSPFLAPSEIQERSGEGKIGFGNIYNTTPADTDKAIESAMLAFKDGLFLVFVDDEEIIAPDQPLQLSHNSTITFIRMTFLAGTYW